MSCSDGRLCFKVCSASKASLVHVRAMSFRMACTRGFGAPSASFSHSAARSLQSSEFNTGIPSQKQWGQSKPGRATVEFFGVRVTTPFAAPPPGFDHG
jgi:hypothetical protein